MYKRIIYALLTMLLTLLIGTSAFARPNVLTDRLNEFLASVPNNQMYLVSASDLKKAVDSKADTFQIIDVRSEAMYKAGHIAKAVNIPLPTLAASEKKVQANKKIYVVCHMDTNSAFAVATLRLLGYNAWIVQGGVPGWIAAGYPVVK